MVLMQIGLCLAGRVTGWGDILNMTNQKLSPGMSSQGHAAEPEDSDVIDIRQLLDYLIRGKWIIAGGTLAVTFLGFAYAFLATPIYQADALIQIEERESDPLSQASGDFAFMLQKSSPAETELQIINSRSILMQVIRDLRLDIVIEPRHFPLIGRVIVGAHSGAGPADPLLGLDSFAWGGETLEISSLGVPREWLGEELTLVSEGDDRFTLFGPDDEEILTGQSGRSMDADLAGFDDVPEGEVLSISVDRIIARAGTRFKLTKLHELSALKHLRANFSASEIGDETSVVRLAYQDKSPRKAELILDKVASAYLELNVKRNSAQAEERLSFIEQQIPNIREDLREDEARLATYSAEEGAFALSEQAKGLIEQYADVQSRLSELTLQKQVMQTRFTARHPRLNALNEQIQEVRADLAQLDDRLRSLPRSEQEFVQLQRDVTVGNELYLQLLSKMQELRVLKAGEIGNVRIVDPPVTALEPIKPRKGLIAALSFLLGGFLSVSLVMLRETLNQGVEDPDKLEQALGLPIYAVVPHSSRQERLQRDLSQSSDRQKKNILLGAAESSDIAIEALRSLRTSMQFALMDAKNNIVLITGPAQGIGKSFTSANLATVAAQTDKRILLIDADMRRGELNRYFGLQRDPGLSQAISGEVTWDNAINATPVKNLDVITTGLLPPNPSELLMTESFSNGLKQVSESYDIVIVDTPPVLAVTDALVAARHAGTVFLLLKSGKHTMREIHHSIARLEKNGVPPHGIVFNDLPRTGTQRYGYYHYSYE